MLSIRYMDLMGSQIEVTHVFVHKILVLGPDASFQMKIVNRFYSQSVNHAH